jgi:hypothetical protein
VIPGDPMLYRSWSSWAYGVQATGLLTLSEVNERLMLEYQLFRWGERTFPRRSDS